MQNEDHSEPLITDVSSSSQPSPHTLHARSSVTKRSPTPSKMVRSGSLGHVSVLMPGQPVLPTPRQKDKFVPLEFGIQEDDLSVLKDYREPTTEPSSTRGRVCLGYRL
jgi:hypothetical protein